MSGHLEESAVLDRLQNSDMYNDVNNFGRAGFGMGGFGMGSVTVNITAFGFVCFNF